MAKNNFTAFFGVHGKVARFLPPVDDQDLGIGSLNSNFEFSMLKLNVLFTKCCHI